MLDTKWAVFWKYECARSYLWRAFLSPLNFWFRLQINNENIVIRIRILKFLGEHTYAKFALERIENENTHALEM